MNGHDGRCWEETLALPVVKVSALSQPSANSRGKFLRGSLLIRW